MIQALRAFERESWLIEASDLSEATGTEVAEIVEGYFSPFCDRLIAESKGLTGDRIEDARAFYFSKFTEMAI